MRRVKIHTVYFANFVSTMRRNIMRNLTGLDIERFDSSEPSRARRKVERAHSTRQVQAGQGEQPHETSICLSSRPSERISQDISRKIGHRVVANTSTSFELHEKELVLDSNSESDDNEAEEVQVKSTTTNYAKRQENNVKNWESIRLLLRNAVVESECIPVGQVCGTCNSTDASYRCLSCGAGIFFVKPVLHQFTTIFDIYITL